MHPFSHGEGMKAVSLLRSSSVDWYCIWPLGSYNPVSPKTNLRMFNQTVLVPSNLDVGVSCLWKFTWNPDFCKVLLWGIRDVSHKSCGSWACRYNPLLQGQSAEESGLRENILGHIRVLYLLSHTHFIAQNHFLAVWKVSFLITQQENAHLMEDMINCITTSICTKIFARFEVIGLQGRTT